MTYAPPPTPQRGLTLIELLAALAVLAILTGVGVPSFQTVLANQRQTAAINTLVASFQQARMRAVTRAGQVIVCPSADGLACNESLSWEHGWLIHDDDNGNRRLDQGETIVQVFPPLEAGLSATSSRGRSQLVYRYDGSTGGSNLRVTVCDDRGTPGGRSVVVNLHGRPRAAPDETGRCQPPAT